jgi:FkbM family methyltransferase
MMWLDWDTALATLGHDQEVKQSYFNMLTSHLRPDVFCDIGANYGSHSLLFLAHGVQTLTFEPNRICMERFRELCAANQLTPTIHDCALGDEEGTIDLFFPPRETWLGMTSESGALPTEIPDGWSKISAPLYRFDHFLPELAGKRVLVKIDAEGAEDKILLGAKAVIAACRPIIIFECWAEPQFRKPLSDLFEACDYAIGELPWSPAQSLKELTHSDFMRSGASNFVAAPSELRAEPLDQKSTLS